MGNISIIIPAYNEEKRIGKMLSEYLSFFNKPRGEILNYEILVVINNTTDGTEKIVEGFCQSDNHVRYLNIKPGGKGLAVIEGFKDVMKNGVPELIGFVDADGATPPSSFYNLIKSIGKNQASIANRYSRMSRIVPKFTFRRMVVARIFNFVIRSLFHLNYEDTQCGAKVFKGKSLEKIIPNLTITQWAFDIDLLYLFKKSCMDVISVPTTWYDIEGSKIKIVRSSIEMFLAAVQLRVMHSNFKRILVPLKPFISLIYSLLL